MTNENENEDNNFSVTSDELKSKLDSNSSLMLFDLRDSKDYERGHIPGAAYAVCNEETKRTIMPRLPKDMEIILVGEEETYAKQMTEMMRQMGLDAKYLKGGISSWKWQLNESSDKDISPIDLKKLIDSEKSKEQVFLLDVREPDEFKEWSIPGSNNIPLGDLSDKKTLDSIPNDKEIVTICPRGNRSTIGKYILERYGYNVRSLEEGLKGWSSSFEIASGTYDTSNSTVIRLFQFRRIGKGCTSYLLDSDGQSIVIDPVYPFDEYIQKAREIGTQIVKVIDTHQHADHISAARFLAKETNAQYLQSAHEKYGGDSKADAQIKDGNVIKLGKIDIKAIHTPGHTLGSISLLVEDHNGDNDTRKNKKSLFTGDTIFVNGVGRPDLRDSAKEFAENLYNTIHQKFMKLPDDLIILPAHFENDVKANEILSSTLGEVKNNSAFLDPHITKEDFVHKISSKVMTTPPNHLEIISINKGEKPIPPSVSEIFDLEMGPNRCSVSG